MFSKAAAPLTFPSVACESPSVSASLSTIIICLSDDAHPCGCKWHLSHGGFDLHFPMAGDAEHLLCPFFKTTFSLKKLVLYIFILIS